jgi:trigger factor
VKSAVENLGPTRVKLTVEVPFEELQTNLDAAYKKIGESIQLKGFRKGKVPKLIIDQRFGRAAVLDEAVNDALPRLYAQALQENDVEALGQPQVDVTTFEDGEQLTFTAEVDAKPDIELPDFSSERVEVPSAVVTDEDVEEQINTLAQRFGSLTDVERAAEDDDFVTIDVSAAQNGEPIEDAQADALSYQVGSGLGIDGLDDAIRGLSDGETATFTSALAAGEHVGEDAEFTVKVSGVRVQKLPDIDDDFAQLASEFDTIDELRDATRSQLERQKRLQQAADARDAVLARLLELTDVPVPDGVIAEEIAARRSSIETQLTGMGLALADYLENEGQTEEEFAADLDTRARDALRSQFILDEIANDTELAVSQDELTEHLIRRAQQANMSPQDFANQAMENDYVPVLVREVVRGKALAQAVSTFTVVDPDGNEIEFDDLLPDGNVLGPADIARLDAEHGHGHDAQGNQIYASDADDEEELDDELRDERESDELDDEDEDDEEAAAGDEAAVAAESEASTDKA